MIELAAVCAALAAVLLIPYPAGAIARLQPRRPGRGGIWPVRRRGTDIADPLLAAQLPDALDFLAVCVSAGLPMRSALSTVAEVSPSPTRELLADVSAGLALGRAGPLAWEELRTHQVWGRVASDIARAERSGSSLAGTLTIHAEDARRAERDAATKRARTVGVKSAVPLMACFLPAFVLVGVIPIIAGLVENFFS